MEKEKLRIQEGEEKEFNDRMAEVVRIELRAFKNVLEQIRDEGKDPTKRRDIGHTIESLKNYKQYRSISIERRVKIFGVEDISYIENAYYVMDIFTQQIMDKFDKYLKIDSGDKSKFEESFEEIKKFVNDSLPHIADALRNIPGRIYEESEVILKAEAKAPGAPVIKS